MGVMGEFVPEKVKRKRPEGAGRKKGTPNKRNVELKDMTLKALKLAGGTRYLAEQAKLNPSAFLTLLGKILPMQVNQQSDNVVKHVLSFDIPAQDAPILAQFKDLGSNEPALPQNVGEESRTVLGKEQYEA